MKSDGLVKHIFPWDFIVWCPELKLSALAYMELILLLITGFLILKVVRICSSADKRLALSCALLQFCYNPFVTMRPYAGSNSNSIFIPELSILSRDVFCLHLMILACVCVCVISRSLLKPCSWNQMCFNYMVCTFLVLVLGYYGHRLMCLLLQNVDHLPVSWWPSDLLLWKLYVFIFSVISTSFYGVSSCSLYDLGSLEWYINFN
jgi:hypothetical protein